MDNTKSCHQLIISMTKFEKGKGENETEKGLDNSFLCKILKKELRARALTHTVQLLRHDAYTVQLYCPINAQIMACDSQSDLGILL